MIKHVDISLLNSCNFRCNYCKSGSSSVRENNTGAFDVSSPVLDNDVLLDYIRNHFDGFVVQYTGGEPLTHPGIGNLLRETVKNNKTMVCTNGSLIPFKKHLLSIPDVLWRISYHPEYRKDKFDEVMKIVLDSGVPYIVNYVCHPRHLKYGSAGRYIENIMQYNHEVSEFEGVYDGRGWRLFDPAYDGIRTVVSAKTFDMEMVVIRPNGKVFDCHGLTNEIGDVYSNTYQEKPCKMGCTHRGNSFCPTYNSIDRILKYYPTFFGDV